MTETAGLRLLAEDAEDLAVIAAALQDAVGKIGDILYEPATRQLTLALNRYRWEAKGGERVRSAIQLGSVLKVQARKLRRGAKDAVVELLNIAFEPGEAPGGAVVFTFAGGGDLRAEVECLDVVLADVSSPWPTPRTPKHEL
ncbi:DUF2948 family protein [Phenylobacterium sp.]|uniref:DUF2948 family protein n=1 Tax=Phenylobacterium sp. TaxID=1871053 RepID=UPI0027312073|nr:DUF2948 family protein [Phenylobacterium sp.]MDP1598895.1 DUF2948 family protein [Phenylobacterium sp.]MDP3594910.1 DUF2948 family protein [Phenylobacterium sp.]